MRFGGENMVSALGLECTAFRNGVAFYGLGWRDGSDVEHHVALTRPLTDPRIKGLPENSEGVGLCRSGNKPQRRYHAQEHSIGPRLGGVAVLDRFRFKTSANQTQGHSILLQSSTGMSTGEGALQLASRATLNLGGGL